MTQQVSALNVEQIKRLREKTGAGVVDCRQALAMNNGNFDLALEYLKRKGLDRAEQKASRTTSEGVVVSYVHTTHKIGVLVEVNCETDFVARTEDFKEVARNIALHVCAMSPRYVSREEIPAEVLEKEFEHYQAEAKTQGKPDHVVKKIARGRLDKWCGEVCLLDQPFVKDPQTTVRDFIKSYIAKLGENIVVRRFVRYELGK